MLSDAKIFWWPEMRKDIEQRVKDCTACLATGKNLNYQIPKNKYGKLESYPNRDKKYKLILPENYIIKT